jgi:hypothetical protein
MIIKLLAFGRISHLLTGDNWITFQEPVNNSKKTSFKVRKQSCWEYNLARTIEIFVF